MPKKNSEIDSLLPILKILEDRTDEENMLTKVEILDILGEKYHIFIDERQFYRKIEALQKNGFEVETKRSSRYTYYFLRRSRLNREEWIYLMYLLMGNRDISYGETKKIIQSLEKMSVCRESRRYYMQHRGQMTKYKTPVNTLGNFSVILDAIDHEQSFSCKLMQETEGEPVFSARKTFTPLGFFFRNNRLIIRVRKGEGEAEIPLVAILDAELE